MFDGDPQARVKDRDRDRATYVIDAALRSGQITQQDRDLRVERVRSAVTVGELGTLTRDIAAPPVPVPATAVVPPVVPTSQAGVGGSPPDPYPHGSTRPVAGVPSDLYGPPPKATKTKVAGGAGRTTKPAQAGRKLVLGCALVVALFVIVPIAAGVIIFASQTRTDFVETDPIPVGPPFELTGAGIRAYVAAFDETFDDTAVVRTVFYDGYVVSWVPQDDGKVAVWNYLEGAFDQLGDPMDGSVDTAPVDLADLRPAKVMSLVREAETTLGVEPATTTYVIYDRDIIEDTPHVMVYVTNDENESGYLTGDLEGNVQTRSAAS